MPLTLEQYSTWLDARDLPWPSSPVVEKPSARPHLTRLPDVRAILWNVYGTLLAIPGGELWFVHPKPIIMNMVLEKTIQEFKMWGSMSRKPGQPSEYMGKIYEQVLLEQKAFPSGGERFPEVAAERVWDAILKKLCQKDYKFDPGFYGGLDDYSRKIAYFFHASLQGTGCYPGAGAALSHCEKRGLKQGILADGQCFTLLQLQRGLAAQGDVSVARLFPSERVTLSHQVKGRKPSERLYQAGLQPLLDKGLEPAEVLYVGSRITEDIIPARRLGMRTALFAGDKASLAATQGQFKETASRPDVLLTELDQLTEVVG
jgi:FMN phosphatase YigB (HAD superfamily)